MAQYKFDELFKNTKVHNNGINTIIQKNNIHPYFLAFDKTNSIYGMNKIDTIIISITNNDFVITINGPSIYAKNSSAVVDN